MEAWPRFRFQTKHISWCFCQSKTSLLSAESTFKNSTERILAFGFQWDSVTRLLPPNSRKRALRTLTLSSTSIQLRKRRKFFFLIAITVKKLRRQLNRVCKCNVQVLRAWHRRSTALILWSSVFFFFFFFWFSAKSYAGRWRETGKKAHGLSVMLCSGPWCAFWRGTRNSDAAW